MTHGKHLNESVQALAYDGGTDRRRYRTFPYDVGTHLSFSTEVQCFAYDVGTDLSFSTEVQCFAYDGSTDLLFPTGVQIFHLLSQLRAPKKRWIS